jgi:vesicular inhibitory amino acid transporter
MIIIAVLVPSFDRIMAFLGSALCFTICIILPLSFQLKIFGKEIPAWERMMNYFLLFICSIMAVVGTVWAFLPKDQLGA